GRAAALLGAAGRGVPPPARRGGGLRAGVRVAPGLRGARSGGGPGRRLGAVLRGGPGLLRRVLGVLLAVVGPLVDGPAQLGVGPARPAAGGPERPGALAGEPGRVGAAGWDDVPAPTVGGGPGGLLPLTGALRGVRFLAGVGGVPLSRHRAISRLYVAW